MPRRRTAEQEWGTPLGVFIRDWLVQKNWTMDGLAEDAKVAPSVLTDIKYGSMPRPESVRKLAEAMGVSPGRLFILGGYLSKDDLVIRSSELDADTSQLVSAFEATPRQLKPFALASILGSLRELQRLQGLPG